MTLSCLHNVVSNRTRYRLLQYLTILLVVFTFRFKYNIALFFWTQMLGKRIVNNNPFSARDPTLRHLNGLLISLRCEYYFGRKLPMYSKFVLKRPVATNSGLTQRRSDTSLSCICLLLLWWAHWSHSSAPHSRRRSAVSSNGAHATYVYDSGRCWS